MKIYYWSPFFTNIATINAVIKSAESLIKYSNNDKFEVSLIDAIGEWEKYEKNINKRIEIIKLNKIKLINYLPKNTYIKSRVSYLIIFFWNFFKLKNLINKKKPDYLIIHLMTSLPIFLSLFLKDNTKIILRISGLPKINILRHLFWKLFSNRIDKITCPTKSTYEFLLKKKIFPKEKLSILSDPIISVKDFLNKKYETIEINKLPNKKFIIGIGRLTKQKNFSLLINAFASISKKNSIYDLVILGEGEEKNDLINLSKKLNIYNKVHFLGFQKNVYKYLIKSHCFILSSLWEDPGFVLAEAAMANTSIISSDCPNGPKDILGTDGFLYKNNSLSDLIEKFNDFENTSKEITLLNKLIIKKKIKVYSQFHHYRCLNILLN